MRPKREVATNNGQTYFVTSNTAQRKPFFRHVRWAELLIETFYGYRPERFLIHGFVVMPDHFHLLMTPQETLERAVQCIKGGFSFRAKKELGWNGDVWLAGFSDHRIRDLEDYEVHQRYIAKNPVEGRLVERAEDHAYCSVNRRFELDAFPQGLKPQVVGAVGGAAEAAPFQNTVGQNAVTQSPAAQNAVAQSPVVQSAAAGVFSKQSKQIGGGVEAPSLQSSTIFLRN
jgi:putative transposase